MSEPIRVLHFLEELDVGGVENFIMNVYRHIDRNKVQFDFALSSGRKMYYDDEVLKMGGHIYYFDNAKSIPQNLMYIFKNKGPFAAVHSHMFFYSGIVVTLARLCRIRVRIAHAHNAHTGESRSFFRRCYESAMKALMRFNASDRVGCSRKACDYVFGKSKRTIVIPDGIDCNRFAYCESMRERIRDEYGLNEKVVIGHVGHFTEAKNHKKVLSVFNECVKRNENAALLLVGNGELEEDVRKMVAGYGLEKQVVFAGAHKDVENMYQAMDVFLFPSKYEGFGMAMIEAQANGLACIASDVVPEDTNADGRAVYLPLSASDEVWGEAVLNCGARNNSEGYETVKNNFDICEVSNRMSGIYLKI